MTSVRSGVLPNLPLKPANHVVQRKKEREPFLPFRFEPRAEGIDHTVFVESDAEGAFFILSEPERQDLEFSLLGPKGQTINRETQASPALRMSSEKENVSWFAVSGDIGGQWILRASRKSEGANKPFQLFAGIKNDAIFLRTRIVVESNCVKFNCTTHHGEPLDFVNTVVDIYRADEYPRSESPLRSIVLQRQQNRHPVFKRNVPVSTGGYYGETNLDPGNFVAEFLVSNPGTAVSANNPGGFPLGDLTETKQRTIPVFTRMDRKHFRVSKDALQATSG